MGNTFPISGEMMKPKKFIVVAAKVHFSKLSFSPAACNRPIVSSKSTRYANVQEYMMSSRYSVCLPKTAAKTTLMIL